MGDRLGRYAQAQIFSRREREMSKRVTSPQAPLHREATKVKGLRRQSLPLDLADELRERILRGEFGDGAVLRQEALAERYGVSRLPVREALRLLEGEGLVTLQAHRGAVVAAPSLSQINELYDLRAMLEKDLIVRAIPNMRPEDADRAEQVLSRLDAAFAGEVIHAWGVLNFEFHRCLYLPSGRERTLAFVQSINTLTERYLRIQLSLTRDFAEAQAEHRQLLQLYRAGRAKEAGAFVERHILSAKRALMEAMKTRARPRKQSVR
jgi:DNA-binding GntR family transcriptional regulator